MSKASDKAKDESGGDKVKATWSDAAREASAKARAEQKRSEIKVSQLKWDALFTKRQSFPDDSPDRIPIQKEMDSHKKFVKDTLDEIHDLEESEKTPEQKIDDNKTREALKLDADRSREIQLNALKRLQDHDRKTRVATPESRRAIREADDENDPNSPYISKASDNTMDNNIVHCRVEAGAEISTSIPWVADRQVKFCWCPGGVHTITAGFGGPVTKFRESALTLTVGVVPDRDAPVCQKSMDEIKAAKQGQEPYGCYEHDEKKASVWADNFESGKDPVYGIPSIILAGRPSGDGADDVNKKNWRRWSPSFGTDADYEKCQCSACDSPIAKCACQKPQLTFPDGVRGSQSNPARITGVAFVLGTLTNRPAFTAMPPVRASRAVEDGHDVVRAGQEDGTVQAAGTSEGVKKSWEKRQRNMQSDIDANHPELRKGVDFSYPSSENAEHFGFKKGGYGVSFSKGNNSPVAMSMHETREAAMEHANKHAGVKWSSAMLYVHPELKGEIAATEEDDSTVVQATWSDAAREASAEARRHSDSARHTFDTVIKMKPVLSTETASSEGRNVSKHAHDATGAAHEANTAEAHRCAQEAHEHAAKVHDIAAMTHNVAGNQNKKQYHYSMATDHSAYAKQHAEQGKTEHEKELLRETGALRSGPLTQATSTTFSTAVKATWSGATDKTATILASVKTVSERQKELMSSIKGGHSRRPSSEEVLARIMASNGLGSAAAAGIKRQCPACQCEAKAQDKTCSKCGARLPAQVAIKNMTDEEATNVQDTPSNRATAETRMM
jgi:hypothetical protein